MIDRLNNTKFYICLIAIVIVAFGCILLVQRGTFVKDPTVEVKALNCFKDTLYVISDEDYRPYSFYDDDGRMSGHDVELVTILANRMKMNLDLKFLSWHDAIDVMREGRADILMTCDYSDTFFGTSDLRKSAPISYDDFVVYSKKRMAYTDELYSKQISVMRDGNVLANLRMFRLDKNCRYYKNNRDAMQALKNGEVDCAIMRNTIGNLLLEELEIDDISQQLSLGRSYMCFAVNDRDMELTSRIDSTMKCIIQDNELQVLREKWLTVFVKPLTMAEILSKKPWIGVAFIMAVLLVFAGFMRSRQIKRKDKKERFRYMQVVDNLAKDFECINYVILQKDKAQDSIMRIRVSDAFRRNIPYWENENLFGKRLDIMADTIVVPEDRERFLKMTRREWMLENVGKGQPYFVNFRAKIDDKIQYYQLKYNSVTDRKGKIVGFVFGTRNIDEEMRNEIATKEKLEKANESKTHFLFNMSHDIRTPMNAIIGFTNLAKKHFAEKEVVRTYLSKIEISCNHLLDLINEVLDMSRVEAGKLHSELKIVDMRAEAENLITICRGTASAKNIQLSLVCNDIKYPVVSADQLHINQIMMNILGNAIKYTMPGGSVIYTVSELQSDREDYGYYEFMVRDTGIGMSKEFLGKVFDSFSREQTHTVSGIQGTGLGMSIVKRLVDYMDGTIDVQSEQGRGTTVSVRFYLKPASQSAMTSEQDKKTAAHSISGAHVLLVEDNNLNREICKELLEELELIVDEAVNGMEAVDKVKKNGAEYYALIIMDIQMPFMNGYEATKAIRAFADRHIPIVALSANAFDEDRQRSFASGMDEHIAKPIDIDRLKEVLYEYIK